MYLSMLKISSTVVLFLVLLWFFHRLWYLKRHHRLALHKCRKGHIAPHAKSYNGGFANVAECKMCHTSVLLDDVGTNPCPKCGSLKRRHYVGIFIPSKLGGYWHERK